MSGILDSKTRIFDTIVTPEGRRHISEGGLKIAYASFTDNASFYSADAVSGTADATVRIYFEASGLPQDNITFKSNDAGRLQPFSSAITASMKNGQLITYSFSASTSSFIEGSVRNVTNLSGTAFSDTIDEIIASSADNFSKNRIIGTHDDIFDDGFAVCPRDITFVVNENKPFKFSKRLTNINSIESLFVDPRFSNLKNFQYLPPISKINDDNIDKSKIENVADRFLGDYPPATLRRALSGDILDAEFKKIEAAGFMKTLLIDPTSKMNNIMAQVFEINDSSASKLDVINFGKIKINETFKYVFFLGKVIIDDGDVQKFVHIFTLVFE